MPPAHVVEVDHLTKTFKLHKEKNNSLKQLIASGGKRNVYEEFVAVDDVSFSVDEGEVFGIIGHNGSGKSTLLKCMAGILVPNKGSATVHRRMSALLELGAGFHPELSGRDNIFLNAAILGMGRKDIAQRFDEIVDFSQLWEFIESPVKTYSSGMYVRLAFAIAINVDPRLLIIDEILAVGDITFQQRCLEKFVEFRNEGRTIVLVTHDLGSVQSMCDRAIWLTRGKIAGAGDPGDLIESYRGTMLGDRVEGSEGTTRRGSGEVRVTKVELLVNGSPIPVKRFRTNDEIMFRLHYEATERIERPVFQISIRTLGGQTITAPTGRDNDNVPPSVSGEGTVEIRIPKVALLHGTYDFDVAITDYNIQHVFDHLARALRFDVMTGPLRELFDGVVTMYPEWSIN